MLNEAEQERLYRLLIDEETYQAGRKLWTYYPETGTLRRDLYAKHLAFFAEGGHYRERAAMAGNRVGKSEGIGAYEVTLHLTGLYPDWWGGKRFTQPVNFLCGGDTGTTTRDIIVAKLLGPAEARGTGMIPRECLGKVAPAAGIPGHVDFAKVKHVTGGWSTVQFRSYDQGREAWQGTERDGIWMDEEPPQDVYAEAIVRTMTTNGMVMSTFTPLRGISQVIKSFMSAQAKPSDYKGPDKINPLSGLVEEVPWAPTKFMVMASWDDAPHLSEESKIEMLQAIPPNQRDARAKGLPTIGAGLIYPCDESIYVKDFEIPKHWAKVYGMDVGWNVTAAVFAAIDRTNDIVYITGEYYGQQQEPVVHADAIKRRGGSWMKGVIDTAARGRSQTDGDSLWRIYKMDQGLKIYPANKAVEAGIYEVWSRMSSGRLKIFKSCQNLERELKMYHRDEKGKINKTDDHELDSMRYLIMSGIPLATCKLEFANNRNSSANVVNMQGYF